MDEKSFDGDYSADNVFEDGVDIYPPNFWLTGNSKVGEEAYFIMDLWCITDIRTISVRNTHAAHWKDSGMKQFSVFSATSASGPWDSMLTTTFSDPRNTSPPKMTFKVTGQGRYFKVQVDSYYGYGGGLQFFELNSEEGIFTNILRK